MASKSRGITPAWEDVAAWGEPETSAEKLAIAVLRRQQQKMADSPDNTVTCIVYDEDLAHRVLVANHRITDGAVLRDIRVLKDTDAFARQNDKGPYHWAQGPQDVTPVNTTPAPNHGAEKVKPGKLPRKGMAVTTTNLRLRKRPGVESPSLGVLPTAEVVTLTGGRKRVDGSLWVHVDVDSVAPPTKRLKEPDVWVEKPTHGWVNSTYLAIPETEWRASDFPPITHEWRWYLEDSGGLDPEKVRKALNAILQDPRGPLRAGIHVMEVNSPAEADILVRMVDDPCNGAAGCYYKQQGQKARCDIGKKWFDTQWLSRVWIHEATGHGALRSYDHYNGAPEYPRPDYSGIMGNWQDHYGDHAWPDEDDIENWIAWLKGTSPYVFVSDLG